MCVYLQKKYFFWKYFFCCWSLRCSRGFWQEPLSWQSSRQWRQVGIHDTHLHTVTPPPYRELLCLTGEGVDPILSHCLLTGKTHEYNLFWTFYYGVINRFAVGNPHRRGTSHSLSSERRTYAHFFLFPNFLTERGRQSEASVTCSCQGTNTGVLLNEQWWALVRRLHQQERWRYRVSMTKWKMCTWKKLNNDLTLFFFVCLFTLKKKMLDLLEDGCKGLLRDCAPDPILCKHVRIRERVSERQKKINCLERFFFVGPRAAPADSDLFPINLCVVVMISCSDH